MLKKYGFEKVDEFTWEHIEEEVAVEVSKIGRKYFVRVEVDCRGIRRVRRYVFGSLYEALPTIKDELFLD